MSSRAKSLIKKWKQLIPEVEDAQQKHAASPEVRSRLEESASISESRMESSVGHGSKMESRIGHGSRMELGEGGGSVNSLRPEAGDVAARRSGGGRSRLAAAQAPVICIDSGDSEDSVVDVTTATTSLQEPKRNHHRNKDKKRKKNSEHQIMDEFSRALEVPDSQHEVHPLSRDSRSRREAEQEDVLIVGQNYLASQVMRERSPATAPHREGSSVVRKCKGV